MKETNSGGRIHDQSQLSWGLSNSGGEKRKKRGAGELQGQVEIQLSQVMGVGFFFFVFYKLHT